MTTLRFFLAALRRLGEAAERLAAQFDHLTADLESDRSGPAGEAAAANGVADEAPAKVARRAAR